MTEEYKSSFEALGLSPGASQEEIKKAYFRLVRTFPPEKEPEQFQRIRRAYEMLKGASPAELNGTGQEIFSLPEGRDIQYLIREANKLIEAENYKAASDCIAFALKLAPDDPYLLLHLARVQCRAGNPRKAARTAERLAELKPDCAEAFAIAGTGYYAGGWYKKAFPAFRKAYALGVRDFPFLMDFADAAAANGQVEEAEKIRLDLLQNTKWDKNNIDAACYLYCGLAEQCPPEEERLLALLDSYAKFLDTHRRLMKAQGEEIFTPIILLGLEKKGALRHLSVYHKIDSYMESAESLGGEQRQLADHLRIVTLSAALDADPRFSDTPWAHYAALCLSNELRTVSLFHFEMLDDELCLMRGGESSRVQANIIRTDYPFFYQRAKENIELLFSEDLERVFERKKREYARLSNRFDEGAFYDLYPEERTVPRGVLVHEDSVPYVRQTKKVGRNDPCPCGSGLKFKRCCLGKGIFD